MNHYRLVSATEKTISNGREEFVSSHTGLWMLVMVVLSYVPPSPLPTHPIVCAFAVLVRFLLGTGRMPHPVGGAMGVT